MDVKHVITLSFSLYLHCNISHPLVFSALVYYIKPVLYEIALFTLNYLHLYLLILTNCGCFYHALDFERHARMALPSTWSICCFMGQTRLLRMPQGTQLFIFLPCTTRQVWKVIITSFITLFISLKVLTDHLLSLSLSLNDQESCVRVLLYRGANKEAKNKHGQTPFQVHSFSFIAGL